MTDLLADLPLPAPRTVEDDVRPGPTGTLVTIAVVGLPTLALVWGAVRLVDHGITWVDLGLTVGLYLVTGFGITLGYHRLFTHKSFRARRGLRIALAVAGSMAAEGSLISWVAHHRRHHVYADHPGDPHSPTLAAPGPLVRTRGLVHAHVGWLFAGVRSDPRRWARDLLADRDLVVVSSLTPLWMGLSLVLPFAVGFVVTGSWTGGLVTMMWAGLVRIAILHNLTWCVNSVGHLVGRRTFATDDRSTDVAVLSLVSLGDSWHNSHHAAPALARHGRGPGELDPSAAVLRVLERLGWATDVRWRAVVRPVPAGGPA